MYSGQPFAISRCFKPFPNCTQVYNCTSGGTNPITWGQLQPLGLASCRSVTCSKHRQRHHHDCPHHPGGFRSRVSSATPTPPPGRTTASTGYFRSGQRRSSAVSWLVSKSNPTTSCRVGFSNYVWVYWSHIKVQG